MSIDRHQASWIGDLRLDQCLTIASSIVYDNDDAGVGFITRQGDGG